ncbi:unnamed protein product [Spirodela intermedia]|uniref:J domain-containing protein n=1 Tax=Spirodela intermedia TaxID=51605 RepID=A0A7I8IBU5_SPIIN|nr:unnamed protein product [Spirodela intermedia]CAA6654351.1 unnamed protein product [Spirodela intermedia]
MADPRAKLVEEICSASSATAACAHRRRNGRKPGFVDWYLVLQLEETAGADIVRRRYRHLALQLHPDKNDHPQAETAFKIVFEMKRPVSAGEWSSLHQQCPSRRLCSSFRSSPGLRVPLRRREKKSLRLRPAAQRLRWCNGKLRRPSSDGAGEERTRRALQAMREEVMQRLRDDTMVIEHCLRARRLVREESPVFDPTDRLLFPEYRRRRHRTPPDAWFLRPQRFPSCYQSRRAGCETPLYEFASASSTEHPSSRF